MAELPNRAPVIDTVPNFIAIVGEPYEYPVHATDPDGDPVIYELVEPQPGMDIDPDSGLLTWTPATEGPALVAIKASDPDGVFGSQAYELDVHPLNDPPEIVSDPLTEAVVGATYRYNVQATDANDDMLIYSLSDDVDPVPEGMTITSTSGLIEWVPDASQEGAHPVAAVVSDLYGGSDEQTFVITVSGDTQPPEVIITFSRQPAEINKPVQVCVQAADNVGVVERTLEADSDDPEDPDGPINLDQLGCATLIYDSAALVTFTATATDGAENVGMDEEVLQVGLAGVPVIELISPEAESVITAPSSIVATITDDSCEADPENCLVWEVRVARFGTEDFTVIGAGQGEVVEDIVALLDPTMRVNDTYVVEISAADGVQVKTIDFRYHISGDYKLGNFSVSFTDLVIPFAGIPMVITRRYDSLDTSQGDFGHGWRMGLLGDVSDSAAESPDEPFTTSTHVYVTRPDGQRVGFTFAPRSVGFPFSFLFVPEFEPDPRVDETLNVDSAAIFMVNGEAWTLFGPYNEDRYYFKTKENVTYTLDEFDGLQHIEDANGNTIDVTPGGLISSLPEDCTDDCLAITFERDEAGRITRITEPDDPDDSDPPGELEYVYDDVGNLVEFRDQVYDSDDPKPTEYFYENEQFPNYLTRIEDPLNRPVVRNVYDEEGRLLAICDANGDIDTLEGCTTFDPDVVGGLQTIVNARGYQTDLIMDERGNVLVERHYLTAPPDKNDMLETVRTYDSDNNLLSETDPEQNTWGFTYDDRGNMLSRTDPSEQRTWSWTYNDCNKVATECDPMNNCKIKTYDEDCDLISEQDALGHVTQYDYNAHGRLSDVVDALGNHWQYHFDPVSGLPIGSTDSRGNTATFHFNVAGDLDYFIDRNGRRIDFSYDQSHRVITESWDTKPPRIATFEYNAGGQLTSAQDPDSTVTITYANTGLLQSMDNLGTPDAPNVLITYGYDANGNITEVTDTLGGTTGYEYDALDRLVSIRQHGTGVNEKRVDLVYSDASALMELRRFADLVGAVPVANTLFDYDCGGCPQRLTSIHHRRASDNSVIHDIDFVRNDVGNILQMIDAQGTHAYAYDGLRRLLSVDHPEVGAQPDESSTYDAVGNRLSSHLSSSYSYTYLLPECGTDEVCGDQLLQDDEFDYEYDNQGNLSLRTDRVTGDYTTYEYDHRNRLIAVVQYDFVGTPVHQVSYIYDSANRRIRTDEDGQVSHYMYDGRNSILTLDAGGATSHRRMFSRWLDDILADEADGQTRWFLKDQVGSVRNLIGNDADSINHYTYDSFGRLLAQTDPSVDNDFLFNGREFSSLIGLGYYRARSYDPRLGRFIQTDPLLPFQYIYADNNPMVFRDPTGELSAVEYAYISVFISFVLLLDTIWFCVLPTPCIGDLIRATADLLWGVAYAIQEVNEGL